MTDKFQVVETDESKKPATRTVAERLSRQQRRTRKEFNGTSRHLALDAQVEAELAKEGHAAWVNDDGKGRLHYLESIGYRYVTNREVFGDTEGQDPDGKVTVRYGTADAKGTPQDIYLMVQPWVFYNEDREEIDKANNRLDKAVTEGEEKIATEYGRSVKYTTK